MSPLTNGVALYKISNGKSGKYATLADGTPEQFITLYRHMEQMSDSESQIWEVSYNAGTGIATIKNPATGNYATVNDLSYVVGDTNAQEFKLIRLDTGGFFVFQEKDSDRVWSANGTDEGATILAKSVPDPTADSANWWFFFLRPGVVSEGEGTLLL